jgi:arginyl-tRNA synthetase
MLDLLDELGKQASRALRNAYDDHPSIPAVVPFSRSKWKLNEQLQPETWPDLQTNVAMQLAKSLQRKPPEIAQTITAGLGHEAVLGTRIDGPGFVNVFIKDAWLAAHAGDGLKLRPVGAGQRVVIDYSSPNVAKPMHIAHIRSTIIGDAVKRVLSAIGYETVADNHLGDWGTQFGKLIVAYKRWLDEKAFADDPVQELLRLYVKYTEEEKRESGTVREEDDASGADAPAILKEARAELVKLQQGDPENVALWKRFVAASMAEFDAIYQRLGVRFDVTLGESFYNDRLAATVERLTQGRIAEESRGALVVFFTKERDGEEMPPYIVRKADGGFNYATTDIAGVLYRMETWSPSRILILTDERQQLHFRQLFATARRLGVKASLEHVWFGLMSLPEGTISTRQGRGLIYLKDLLDEAERRAFDVATQASPELPEAERRAIARVVGIGAVKYNDLCRDRQTNFVFTWDKALALTGNSGPYLQYACARVRSILRMAAEEDGAVAGPIGALEPEERALVLRLLAFPEAVESVARTAKPHTLCEYLFDLAGAYSTFYEKHPVRKAEPAVRASRLTLCSLTADTLQRGLGLLGIETLERM